MWSALALDAWGSVPAQRSTACIAGAEVPTDTSGSGNAWPSEERNGTGGDSGPVRAARERLTLFGAIQAIILWILSKAQRVVQAAVVCTVAIMFLPLVLAGAMVTLLASASVHYLMSGYNNFNVGEAPSAPTPQRVRLRMPSWNARNFRSWGGSDSESDSEGEGEGRVSRWTRRSRLWLRNRAHSIAIDTENSGDQQQQQQPSGRRSLRKALAARMRRFRGTLKNLSPRGFRASAPSNGGFGSAVTSGRTLKDKARLVVADGSFLEDLLGDLPGVDVSSQTVQAAILNVKEALRI